MLLTCFGLSATVLFADVYSSERRYTASTVAAHPSSLLIVVSSLSTDLSAIISIIDHRVPLPSKPSAQIALPCQCHHRAIAPPAIECHRGLYRVLMCPCTCIFGPSACFPSAIIVMSHHLSQPRASTAIAEVCPVLCRRAFNALCCCVDTAGLTLRARACSCLQGILSSRAPFLSIANVVFACPFY